MDLNCEDKYPALKDYDYCNLLFRRKYLELENSKPCENTSYKPRESSYQKNCNLADQSVERGIRLVCKAGS